MTKRHILFLFCFLAGAATAQKPYTDRGPQDLFATPYNPYYWKNKLPFSGYWQQDVHYKINASIDETTDVITGKEELRYRNNSPDTLHVVYFNLYQNAFQPNSYLDDLQRHNGVFASYGHYERKRLGIVLDSILSEGILLDTLMDNTVVKVILDKPLPPNSEKLFSLRFRTYFDSGSIRRRMKKYKVFGQTHYNGCQWYPKLCVYDRKSGWNTDQHLGREFYGDFGTFDVALTFAANYVVEATGVLQNESEVLPDTLKKKLDIYNFKDKKWDEKPSVIIPYVKGETKTWIYHAENVHDFAFTADPSYRIHDTIIYPGRANGEGVRCVAIVQEAHASGWQNGADYLAKIIETFSRDFGAFEYPKIVIADAADGMEYPMLTLDGGRDKNYRGLLVHEVGHNWFYGMLGNNEQYRAMMDEGFTQFLTAWGMEAINGDTIPYDLGKNKYYNHFFEPINVRDRNVYYGYLRDAVRHNDQPLNTHSDAFNGALGQGGGYGQVYYKTATMLYNLQYVLGDALFAAAMKNYVAQWKFCHPYPEDFRNSIIHFTHIDLNWFFDQWIETTKNIDYAIAGVRRTKEKDQYRIKLRRKGRMQMPIDLQVTARNDSVYNFYIPNTWFEKQMPPKTRTLPKWYGWDKLHPTYTATVHIPEGIKNVVIDPGERLADINMLNNRRKGNVQFRFNSHVYPYPSWRKYQLFMRPDIWWNAYDGLKLGVHLEGNYMTVKHNFSLTLWVNSHLLQGGKRYGFDYTARRKAGWFSYNFSYSHALDKAFKNATFYFKSRWLDGLELYQPGMVWDLPRNFSLNIDLKAFTRNQEEWRSYLLYPKEWSAVWTGNRKFNTSLNVSLTYSYHRPRAYGNFTAHLRSSALFSSFNYHYFEWTQINHSSAWKLDFHTRVYGRIGTGKDWPAESALYLAGGNPEEMMEDKYYRAAGFAPPAWATDYGATTNRIHFAGGLNMRGYSGYLVTERDKEGNVVAAYKGVSGASVNAEIDFNRIVPVKNQWLRQYFTLRTYLFGDAGVISYTNTANRQQLAHVRFDAGVGAALTIKKWGVLERIKPLTLRFDVPFFISRVPFAEPQHFKFRWVVGIGRAF